MPFFPVILVNLLIVYPTYNCIFTPQRGINTILAFPLYRNMLLVISAVILLSFILLLWLFFLSYI